VRVLTAAVLTAVGGCASTPTSGQPLALPQFEGSYYDVRPGDTLWGIAHAFGMSVERLAAANRPSGPAALTAGERVFVPLPDETPRFLWPAHAPSQRAARGQGVTIAAPEGSPVRAARAGVVAAAARDIPGWGPTLVVDHGGDAYTVYAGLEGVLTAPGASVRQGAPIALAGPRGVYFEIRHGPHPQDPLALLP
jgi:murein DD-endopeptidase MepM/ murein hydrolase activator NlpD